MHKEPTTLHCTLSPNTRDKTKTLTLPTPNQQCIGGFSWGNQAQKKNKDIQTEKGKVKLFICRCDKPCTNDWKNTIISEFSNIAGYKLDIQKPNLFLYFSNEIQDMEN